MTRSPLDPQLAAVLTAVPQLVRPVLPEHVARIRSYEAHAPTNATDAELRRGGAVEVHERLVPIACDATLGVLVLRPASGRGPWPGVVHIHGGGMMFGDNRTGLAPLAEWVETLGVVVASISYRLAPEHPDPVPVEDCSRLTEWVATHAGELGIDDGPLVLAGSSAGGGLAAGVAILARERGGPKLGGQLLFSPMLDDRSVTPSSRELDGDAPWDHRSNVTGWTALLGVRRGTSDVSPASAPARCDDLRGLPPTYIDVGAVETFRDEAMEYALRLSGAGVAVEAHLWAGAFHGFDALAPASDVAAAARQARMGHLRRLLRDRAAR